jgi:hypothetical protein
MAQRPGTPFRYYDRRRRERRCCCNRRGSPGATAVIVILAAASLKVRPMTMPERPMRVLVGFETSQPGAAREGDEQAEQRRGPAQATHAG